VGMGVPRSLQRSRRPGHDWVTAETEHDLVTAEWSLLDQPNGLQQQL